ncbi:MAG: hypothetical protein WA943_02805 [Parvibaculum sp.]|uniref:hypothetical protein n=1 Tax=Parvibaculum sp. TaxID=2024848 RepID=UPI003C70A60D
MTDFAASAAPALHGKHNMASDAFDALRTARAQGKTPQGQALSFSDLLDTINPLQHIPVVAQAYRHLTGDTISPQARVAGGALYGGPIGLVLSVADAAIASVSGEDIGEHVIAGLFGSDKPEPTTVATATPPATAQAADTTGSIAPAATPASEKSAPMPAAAPVQVASKTPPQPLPQLSPDAFNALIGSFADPKAAKAANPEIAAKVAAADAASKLPLPAAAKPVTGKPDDLMAAMQTSLDQLDALKAANTAQLPAAAFAPGDTGGF